MRRLMIAVSYVGILAIPAVAKTPDLPDIIMSENGTCNKLSTPSGDLPCKGTIVNTIFDKEHRTGFYFTGGDTVVTFTGSAEQIKPDADTAVQPLDRIILNTGKGPKGLTAVGSCRYTNPYTPEPIVKCHAETEDGTFDASFVGDGHGPKRLK